MTSLTPSLTPSYNVINLLSQGRWYNSYTFPSIVIPSIQGGYGVHAEYRPVSTIQTGNTPGGDGIALISPTGVVLEFISYDGEFMAIDGPAKV